MIVADSETNREKAAQLLINGQLVALPTETVYGLAADALNATAVAAIFKAKNRPQFNPLIAHVSDKEMAGQFVEINHLAEKLMDSFWPGPLSFVLPLQLNAAIASAVTAGLETLAIRCPQGVFADIIRRVGKPLAAPSANTSGKISPTRAEAVEQDIGSKIPLVLDGGACSVGVESTIIKIDGEDITLLRAGGISRQQIEEIAQKPVKDCELNAAISAPGMLKSHYAPQAKVRLNVQEVFPNEALLGFGSKRVRGAEQVSAFINLSEEGDLNQAAAQLFAALASLDAKLKDENSTIAVEPIPETGIGEAINDRLYRAAADRET